MRTGEGYRHPRRPVGYRHEFEHGFEIVEAVIHDLSRFGARVDGDFNFAGPDELSLLFQGKKFKARIVWMRFGTLGLAFETPLDKETYTALLGHASTKRTSGMRLHA